MKNMILLKCSIHNITFGAEGVEAHLIPCPKCWRKEWESLKDEVKQLTKHRDALLTVIEIKGTAITAIKEGEE